MPSQSTFTTVRSEGGLLPSDLLARVVAGDSELGGLTPADYGFAPTERIGEAISRLWNDAKTYWEAFKTDQKALVAGETGVSETRDWVLRLLREIGYGRPEYRAAAEEINGRRYAIQHRSGPVPLHILTFQQDIDRAAVAAAGQPRLSPHALLQEYLNVSGAALYGMVTNGLRLRLLRDNASITRLASVEFDLEAMFENSVYADFVLLFLILHRTRLPQEGQEVSACWLEIWRSKAETQGTRALGALRAGVEKAIETLGNGLLAHEDNDALRDRLIRGDLTTEAFYAELLRVVYRLIFLFVAEERDLLYPEDSRPEMRQRYTDHYSATRLRGIVRRFSTDDRHDDLWRSLRLTFDLLAGRREGLDLVALEGLFAADACPESDAAMLGNNYLAEAVLHLSNVRVDKRVRRVNYRDIGAEELGGVYEGLLDRQPRVTVDAPLGQRFALVASGQRKSTGSYYTPASLVHELIKSALEPVIADRLTRAGSDRGAQERALLDISVCDAACGSGHFLLAAARRIAAELARLRSDDREPGQNELRRALRDVVRHCIYGVDLNPLAVDLCRLSLWLESQDKGRPLSFLDHHIKLGNSLVGSTPELLAAGIPDGAYEPVSGDDKSISLALKKRNRQERGNQLRLFGMDESEWRSQRAALAQQMLTLATLPEDAAEDVRKVRASYEAYRREQVDPARWGLDTWTAAFFWSLTPQAPPPPTTFDLRARRGTAAGLSERQHLEVERLRDAFRFFHWPLEFPEVFQRGGFDCMLGNPPWDMVQLDPGEYFASRSPEISSAPNQAKRQRMISALPATDPLLAANYAQAKRANEAFQKFIHQSDCYPLSSRGRLNLAPVFVERTRSLLGEIGRSGLIVPTGLATDAFTQYLFRDFIDKQSLSSLFDFQNRDLFPGVGHGVMKFCLLTLASRAQEEMDLSFFSYATDHLRDERRHIQLTPSDFALLNPNTGTCPIFRTSYDADLTRSIYRRVPVVHDERSGANPWGLSVYLAFMMNSDSHLFLDRPDADSLPLYEAKLFHQYSHRWATYDGKTTRDPSDEEMTNALWAVNPHYWIPRREAQARFADRGWTRDWVLAYRRIARSTDERTLIASILPMCAPADPADMLLVNAKPPLVAALLACLNSLVLDYVVRQKVGGSDIRNHYFKQFPLLPPEAFDTAALHYIVPRVIEMTFTACDVAAFAQDCGYIGAPFVWDSARRSVVHAELDAYIARLYGLTYDDLLYVLDPSEVHGPDFPGETFRVLRQRELKESGVFKTRKLVLDAWHRLDQRAEG